MGIVRERLSSLSVNTTSAEGMVHARLTISGGIQVTLEQGVTKLYNQESICEQIEDAVQGALAGYSEAIKMIQDEAYGVQELDPKSYTAKKREEYADACGQIDVQSVSRRKFVMAQWMDNDTFFVAFKDGAMERLDEKALEMEINSAISAVVKQRSKKVQRIQQEIYLGYSGTQGK